MKPSDKDNKPTPKTGNKQQGASQTEKLQTDHPLSEKDEVKQAEHNLHKQQNNSK